MMREREAALDKDDDIDPLPTPLSNFNGDRPYYLPQNDHALYYRKSGLLWLYNEYYL